MRRRSSLALLTLSLIVLVVLVVFQVRQYRRATPPAGGFARVVPSIANLTAPARLNVLVRAPVGMAGDSIRTILERDFEYGDWLHVVPPESSSVAIIVQATVTMKGVRMTLVDGANGRTLRSANFQLPSIATSDSTSVADSLVRDLAAKDAVTQSLLKHNAHVADSLRALQPSRPSSFWLPPILRRGARAATSRDSLLRILAHADADIRARAKHDTAAYEMARQGQRNEVAERRDELFCQWRWALHGIADQMTKWIAGHTGIAQSRIAYVTKHELRTVDADGENDKVLARGDILMSPSWRHDGAAIVFSQLNTNGTEIAQLDLATGKVQFVPGIARGLNITPVYSPDDQSIVFARGSDHGTDIVIVPATGGIPRRLVGSGADNAGPTFDVDGGRIAFSSARGQTPQIYSIAIDGSDERLETPAPAHGRSYRTSPDWSPDGNAIAFEQQNGNFQIWTVSLPDHTFRRLTTVGENEDPSWAPDGRHITFSSTRNGTKTLWVLDIPSGRMRQLTKTGGSRLASWSPVGTRRLEAP